MTLRYHFLNTFLFEGGEGEERGEWEHRALQRNEGMIRAIRKIIYK